MRLAVFAIFLFLVGCFSGAPALLPAPADKSVGAPPIDLCAHVTCAPPDEADIRIHNGKLIANGKELTPEYAAIDSYSVSLERREVVFSAKRKDNFDVGLVSLDGGEIHWLPEDPRDEVSVQWAPRGNKVSYIVPTRAGDLVRSVHVPTAVQVVADFPYARVRALGWDPSGERYAVAVSSPDASDRVESLKYDGSSRRIVFPPAVRLDVLVEPFAGGVIVRPSLLRYNERIPLVIWIDDRPLVWNDARGALMRDNKVAVAIVDHLPDQASWKDLAWVDEARLFVVGARGSRTGTTYIVPSDDVPAGRYRAAGNVVEVSRAIVESFASGWIAQRLKAPNGRR